MFINVHRESFYNFGPIFFSSMIKSKRAGYLYVHIYILLYPVFSGVVLLVILIFFSRSGCSPFARDDRKQCFEGIFHPFPRQTKQACYQNYHKNYMRLSCYLCFFSVKSYDRYPS